MDEKIFNIRLCPECEEMDRKHKELVREELRLVQVNFDEAISNADGENSS